MRILLGIVWVELESMEAPIAHIKVSQMPHSVWVELESMEGPFSAST